MSDLSSRPGQWRQSACLIAAAMFFTVGVCISIWWPYYHEQHFIKLLERRGVVIERDSSNSLFCSCGVIAERAHGAIFSQGKGTDDDLALLCQLAGIRKLCLDNACVTDVGMGHLARMKNLEHLDLYRTKVTPAGLAMLRGLKKLQRLELEESPICDACVAELSQLKALVTMNLSYTRVTDAGLAHLARLSKLGQLILEDISISDAGLEYLCDIPGLVVLGLTNTQVTDAGLTHLTNMPRLKQVYLCETRVTAAAIEELQFLMPDCAIGR
jgi:hypothetical protein